MAECYRDYRLERPWLVHLDAVAAAGRVTVDAWADAAVQIIDRTLYLSKDGE